MEDRDTGVLTETGCEAKERNPKLQSRCADIGDVEVVRIVYRSSSRERKKNPKAGNSCTWEALMVSVVNIFR